MKSEMKSEIKNLLIKGYTVEYRDLTICRISNYHVIDYEHLKFRPAWQVSTNNPEECNGYYNLDDAIDEFLRIKGKKYEFKGKSKKL